MRKITITIDMNNSAFDDNEGFDELVRIMEDLTQSFKYYDVPETIRDINGARVGTVEVE